MEHQPILLTSLPRSGSTWVLKVLGAAPGIFPMFEPDHLPEWGLGEDGMHPYLRNHDAFPGYYNMYRRVFEGAERQRISLSWRYFRHIQRRVQRFLHPGRRVLVKSVFSLANTSWIYTEFRPRVVVLLRNPYSIVHSIHRRWPDARLKKLTDQSELMEDYLSPYRDILESAKSPYEQLAARVGAYYRILEESAKHYPEWSIVQHEDLCSDPIAGFRGLYQDLGLEWTQGAQALVEASNKPKQDDAVQHVNRLASHEIDKWRTLLSLEEIAEISRFYDVYGNRWYTGLAG